MTRLCAALRVNNVVFIELSIRIERHWHSLHGLQLVNHPYVVHTYKTGPELSEYSTGQK